MRTITITGEDRHIENVVKENRGRVDRGFITVSEGTEAKALIPAKVTQTTDTKNVNPESK